MENHNKLLLSLGLASVLLAGCSSTPSEDESQAAADSGSYTYGDTMNNGGFTTDDSMLNDQQQEPAAVLKTVFYFEFDDATLSAEARQDLNAQVARLRDTRGLIRLEGHTDERGTREYNMALGERRAQVVADYLVVNGIPRYRIETVSLGEERRADFGYTEAAHAKNRRVELK